MELSGGHFAAIHRGSRDHMCGDRAMFPVAKGSIKMPDRWRAVAIWWGVVIKTNLL